MAPPWALVQYVRADARPRVGVLADGHVHAAPDDWPSTALDLLDAWREWEPALRHLDVTRLAVVPDAELAAPLTYPRKLLGTMANYHDHAKEMSSKDHAPGELPFFFLRPPSTTVVGDGARVRIPRAAKVDWGAQLGVVIADRCKGVAKEDAMSHVAGYLVANDLAARGLFIRETPAAPPLAFDWYGHKAPDDSAPIGPGIVPSWMVPDISDLRITLSRNGVTKQDSTTAHIIDDVPTLIAAASLHVTLEPGDVLCTGTPAGVGLPRGEFLEPGDVLVAAVEGIGTLRTVIE